MNINDGDSINSKTLNYCSTKTTTLTRIKIPYNINDHVKPQIKSALIFLIDLKFPIPFHVVIDSHRDNTNILLFPPLLGPPSRGPRYMVPLHVVIYSHRGNTNIIIIIIIIIKKMSAVQS